MRRYLPTLFLFLFPAWPVDGYDVVHLKTGDAVKGSIESLGESSLRFKVIVENVRGSGFSYRKIKKTDIAFIDFDEDASESKLSGADLAAAVRRQAAYLGVPNSRAGELTLCYVQHLLESSDKTDAAKTLYWCDQVIAKDWDEQRCARAALYRLQALVNAGRGEEAAIQASRVLSESREPSLLCEAHYVLGAVRFDQLKVLVIDHPRWNDDDEVRPQRNLLFDGAIDAFLYPSLFHGSLADPSARGLWASSQVFAHADDIAEAQNYAQDVITLYPNTPQAVAARQWLDHADSQPK